MVRVSPAASSAPHGLAAPTSHRPSSPMSVVHDRAPDLFRISTPLVVVEGGLPRNRISYCFPRPPSSESDGGRPAVSQALATKRGAPSPARITRGRREQITLLCRPSTPGALRLTLRTNGLPFVLSGAERSRSGDAGSRPAGLQPIGNRARRDAPSASPTGAPDIRRADSPC